MSPREALTAETREWLERAEADLEACTALIAAGRYRPKRYSTPSNAPKKR